VFEAAEKMIEVVCDTARGFVHESPDLTNGHRIAEQHLD
jgi:hypothetical protein